MCHAQSPPCVPSPQHAIPPRFQYHLLLLPRNVGYMYIEHRAITKKVLRHENFKDIETEKLFGELVNRFTGYACRIIVTARVIDKDYRKLMRKKRLFISLIYLESWRVIYSCPHVIEKQSQL